MRTLIWDLDGCLCDERHRNIHAIHKDWRAYHDLVHLDTPLHTKMYKDTFDLVDQVIVLTGREERCREDTIAWFHKNEMELPHVMIMRPKDSCILSVDHKRLHVVALRECGHDIIGAFDDRKDIVSMYKQEGVIGAFVLGYKSSQEYCDDVRQYIFDKVQDTEKKTPLQVALDHLDAAKKILESIK